jgi:hypothetical protein
MIFISTLVFTLGSKSFFIIKIDLNFFICTKNVDFNSNSMDFAFEKVDLYITP